jgi:DNA-binding NarL/FixJ family response regulator
MIRILIADDHAIVRAGLKQFIADQADMEVTAEASSGSEAIAAVRARDFDVVLLDLTVSGGMGGVETAARLKMLAPSLKLIVSSGYSDGAVMSDFRRYGFDDVLPKPWNVSQLTEVVRKVCARNPDRAG